ncbi:4-alpha-glucanotransferase [Oscillibacter sp. PC13]|uniref:4-alpha-glucanotransferase n=1 Tax=Oscillibacter sp. PC13 TaxID=1855299 RepID=UPI0008E78E84|nr:4-alpha-glucanotransferase [Oscillibacter sp. PC13]SFO92796.1 4-alpha-glucanotransferase [Oscillibacter sp. PC13]
MERSAGILLPIFSLPSPYGIGSLGREARVFADFLHAAGQRWWQILPVGPTGAGNSPYTSVSTFAGNPLLIDLELLEEEGLLDHADLKAAVVPAGDQIDYAALRKSRTLLLRKAFFRGYSRNTAAVQRFIEQNVWVKEYALYMASKENFGNRAWPDWPDEALRRHVPEAVKRYRRELREAVAFHTYVQYLFFTQWAALKRDVNHRGIRLIGDLPIYVSLDSSDTWSERREFLLDSDGKPAKVAGVPPDYFSEEGQLWGNPLYDWKAQQADGFGWWIRRVEGASRLFDAIRIDHFRAFEHYWAVPSSAKSAKEGNWEQGPGMALLGVLTGWFPQITYIAEDLGLLTDAVHQLRDEAGLPGMKVLEFAFSGPDNAYLPHHYTPHCICYTGTHDNDTLLGWYDHAAPEERAFAEQYLGVSGREAVRRGLLRLGQGSVAELFVAQMQDYLALGCQARINVPGVAGGNWRWNMLPGQLTEDLAGEIREMTACYGRCSPTDTRYDG